MLCQSAKADPQGSEVCGMGTPVLHIVFRLSCSERCVFQLRALRLRADEDWGGALVVCLRGREDGLGRVGCTSMGWAVVLRLSHVLC